MGREGKVWEGGQAPIHSQKPQKPQKTRGDRQVPGGRAKPEGGRHLENIGWE